MRISISFSLAVLFSCGAPMSIGNGHDGGVFKPTAPECIVAQRHCDALAQCGDDSSRALNRSLFGYADDADCVATMKAKVDSVCYQIDSSLEAGRIDVDRAKTSACHRAIQALSCEDYLASIFNQPLVCQGRPFVTGKVELGDTCSMDMECAGDAVCSAESVCVPLPHRGQPCAGTRCEEGLSCESGVCGGSTVCKNDSNCAESEYCDQPGNDFELMITMPGTMGTCAPKRALGADCDDLYACQNTCSLGATRPPGCTLCAKTNGFSSEGYRNPGTCQPAKAAGASCSEDGECRSAVCKCPGLFSCSDGVCQ